MHHLFALREKRKVRQKRKKNDKRKGDTDKERKGEARDDESRLLCLPVWHVPGSHDVNQRTCLSRGRELFLRQVQRSISRGMIDAPAACNSPRISSPRMRKLRDRENDLYKPKDLYGVSRIFRMFFFFQDWLTVLKLSLDEINSSWKPLVLKSSVIESLILRYKTCSQTFNNIWFYYFNFYLLFWYLNNLNPLILTHCWAIHSRCIIVFKVTIIIFYNPLIILRDWARYVMVLGHPVQTRAICVQLWDLRITGYYS